MNFIACVLILKQQRLKDRDVGHCQTYQNLASSWQKYLITETIMCTICQADFGTQYFEGLNRHFRGVMLCYVMLCDVVLFYELQEPLTSWTET